MDIVKILIVIILAVVMVGIAWAFLRRKVTTASTGFYAPPESASRPPLPQEGKPDTKPAVLPPAPMPISAPPQQSERTKKAEKEEEQSAPPPPARRAPAPPPAASRPQEISEYLSSYRERAPQEESPGQPPEPDAEDSWGGATAEEMVEPDAGFNESDTLDDEIRFGTAEPQPVIKPAPAPAAPARSAATNTELSRGDPKTLLAVHFSAYYPREVRPMDWQPLKAYLFRRFMADKVAEDAQAQLGERLPGFRKAMQVAAQPVTEGAMVTATPDLPGFQFNPPSMTVGFYKDMHRFDFELRATDAAPLNQATNGTITFTVEGVIVGDVPLSVFVGETADAPAMSSAETRLYQAIFCSYSHDDTTIVERVERAYKALGLDYLRDVMTLKAGQDWSAELLNLIEQADIFQLFWSQTAAASQHVRYEWEHALKIAPGREKFIRPVYWEQPMPAAPSELSHIHFTYQPDLAK